MRAPVRVRQQWRFGSGVSSTCGQGIRPCLLAGFLWMAGLAGCGRELPSEYVPAFGGSAPFESKAPEYTLGVLPLHNALRLFEVYQPVVEEVNHQAPGFSVRLESSRNYTGFDGKLRNRRLDFALVNPYQAVVAEQQGYRIFGKMAGDGRLRGIIVVRRGSKIRTPRDLRGASISFPGPTAFAATMLNKAFLKSHGLDVEREATVNYVGSQDSAVMNVFLGLTQAGGTWPPTWEAIERSRPDVARALEVKWRTEPLVNLALVARDDLPEEHVQRVAGILFRLHTTESGRRILQPMKTSRYEPATSATYDPVRRFMKKYERMFGDRPARGGAR